MLQIPRGTLLAVELVDPVDSGKNKEGDSFRARVEDGVWVRGRVAVPPGTTARGVVIEAEPSGRVKGRAKLAITLKSLELEGSTYTVHTDSLSYRGDAHTGQHIGSWLGGALQGALYGVLFGGKAGAVIGAGAGAAAGAGSAVLNGKLDIEFKQGAKLMFETKEAFTVPEPPAPPPGAPSAAAKAESKPPPEPVKAPEKETPKEKQKPEAKPST